jgi:hypothetical protein
MFKHRVSPTGRKSNEKKTVSITTGSLVNNTVTEVTAALAGLSTTDIVVVNAAAALTTNVGICGARCSAAGVLAVSFVNPTAATIASFTPSLRVAVQHFGG